jgi:hypothetical protein
VSDVRTELQQIREALENARAERERDEARQALRFYADPGTYALNPRVVRPITTDQGERARAALAAVQVPAEPPREEAACTP